MNNLTRAQCDRFYNECVEQLIERPHMLAGSAVCAESFLFGLDIMARFVAGGSEGGYRQFLVSEQFKEHTFTSRFLRENGCRVGFVSTGASQSKQDLELEFSTTMREHLQHFLSWREQNAGGT